MYETALQLFVKNAAASKAKLLTCLLISWTIVGLNFFSNGDGFSSEYKYQTTVVILPPLNSTLILEYLPFGYSFSDGGKLLDIASETPLTMKQVEKVLKRAAMMSVERHLEESHIAKVAAVNTWDDIQRTLGGYEALLKISAKKLQGATFDYHYNFELVQNKSSDELILLSSNQMVQKKSNAIKQALQLVITLIVASISAIFLWCVFLLFRVVFALELKK